MSHDKLEKFLSGNANPSRDFEVEEVLKHILVSMDFREIFDRRSSINYRVELFGVEHRITPTFESLYSKLANVGRYRYCFDDVSEFIDSVDSTEYSFAVYFTYITFFKLSDRSEFVEFLNSKIVNSVLSK